MYMKKSVNMQTSFALYMYLYWLSWYEIQILKQVILFIMIDLLSYAKDTYNINIVPKPQQVSKVNNL